MQGILHSGLAATASTATGKEGTSRRQTDYSLLAWRLPGLSFMFESLYSDRLLALLAERAPPQTPVCWQLALSLRDQPCRNTRSLWMLGTSEVCV